MNLNSQQAPMTTEPDLFDGTADAPAPATSTDVMLDVETLGREPFCPVLSIGACRFAMDPDLPLIVDPETDMFHQAIRLESCLELGLKIDADTLQWWMLQSKEAQDTAFRAPDAVDLPIALDAFTDWLNSRPDLLWGNSARFDMGILASAYKACGKVLPWEHWNERCYRTAKNLPYAKAVKLVRHGTYHNALDDAISQADHLRRIMMVLGG